MKSREGRGWVRFRSWVLSSAQEAEHFTFIVLSHLFPEFGGASCHAGILSEQMKRGHAEGSSPRRPHSDMRYRCMHVHPLSCDKKKARLDRGPTLQKQRETLKLFSLSPQAPRKSIAKRPPSQLKTKQNQQPGTAVTCLASSGVLSLARAWASGLVQVLTCTAHLDLSLRDVEDGREVVAGVHQVLPLAEHVDLTKNKHGGRPHTNKTRTRTTNTHGTEAKT